MTEIALACPDCRLAYEASDNYCRNCGMFLATGRSLTVSGPSGIAEIPNRPGLPAPVRRAATAMAIGAALQIGVGLAGRYLVRQAARQAITAPVKRSRRERREPLRSPADRGRALTVPDEVAAVQETVIVHRAWTRRG